MSKSSILCTWFKTITDISLQIEDCTAYKPVDSTECLDYGVDFNENEGDDHRESLHFYDEVMRSISEDVIGDEDDYGSKWNIISYSD